VLSNIFEVFSFKGYDQQPPGFSKPGFLFLASPARGFMVLPGPNASTGEFAASYPPAGGFLALTEFYKQFYILVWFIK
jgi:hypothetical protein